MWEILTGTGMWIGPRADVKIFDNNPMFKGLTLGINTDDGGLEEMRLHRGRGPRRRGSCPET